MNKNILSLAGLAVVIILTGAGCDKVEENNLSEPQKTPEKASVSEEIYTMAQIEESNTTTKCWTAINGFVYDVGSFVEKHPGGDKNILKLCGKDGTTAFNGKHGGQEKPEQTLESFKIGKLK